MKKKLYVKSLFGMLVSMFLLTMPAYAGTWQQTDSRWWYQNDDMTYPKSTWQWIDGNQDGIAECYYFDAEGWMLQSTQTPDFYEVDANGAWIKDGIIQSKPIEEVLPSGWQSDSRGWRYLSKKAFLTSEWKKLNGKKYYFDESAYMVTGFQEIDGLYYYFDESGALKDKTFYLEGIYYIIDPTDDYIIEEVYEEEWADYQRNNPVDEKMLDHESIPEEDLVSNLTDEEAKKKILALKKSYPEGRKWTNANSYHSKDRIGYGCAGFAYIVQDRVFGKDAKKRVLEEFDADNIRVGDHFRIYSNSSTEHSVIILDFYENGVILAEGNYNSSIHWGRKMSYDTLEAVFIYQETCY